MLRALMREPPVDQATLDLLRGMEQQLGRADRQAQTPEAIASDPDDEIRAMLMRAKYEDGNARIGMLVHSTAAGKQFVSLHVAHAADLGMRHGRAHLSKLHSLQCLLGPQGGGCREIPYGFIWSDTAHCRITWPEARSSQVGVRFCTGHRSGCFFGGRPFVPLVHGAQALNVCRSIGRCVMFPIRWA